MTIANHNRGALADEPFSFRATGEGRVMISWRGKPVMTLKGNQAASFIERVSRLSGPDQQLVMAKITGNFKRGNERHGGS